MSSILPDSFSRSILLASLSDLSTPHFLAPVISCAASATRTRLLIIFISPIFANVSHTEKWDEVQRLLTFVYVQATKVAQDMGKALMEVDVIFKGRTEDLSDNLGDEADVMFCIEGGASSTNHIDVRSEISPVDGVSTNIPPWFSRLQRVYLKPGSLSSKENLPQSHHSKLPSLFPVVALGGTFDHLHAGHKILLSMGAWITSEKIIVGVTGRSATLLLLLI
jgi:hypothetical protein